MFLSHLNATRRPWPTKRPSSPNRSPLLALTFLFSLLLFISYYYLLSSSSSSPKTLTPLPLWCSFASPEKFLFFAPHSGFSNQLSELRNALLLAGILNRTLVVPPVLDHHAVALGSCPKFRVSSPGELRVKVWDHAVDLIRSGRYISIVDIVDISSLTLASLVRAIDFRVFASQLCNLSLDGFCVNDSNGPLSSSLDSLKRCGSVLSAVDGNAGNCLYAVEEDCRTTVWTYRNGHEDGALDSFQPDEQLKMKKNISYVRKRRDVYKSLGPGSEAYSATVLAFGSLFSSLYKNSESYIDIHESPRDQRIQDLIETSAFLPFAPEITSAGKRFVRETIQTPFLCAQLRLLDGQFKNHWESTFLGLKQKVESLEQKSRPVRIFVMTDLPEVNWTGSFLGDLATDMNRFKLFSLKEHNDLVVNTARRLGETGNIYKRCGSSGLPDVLLYIEKTICSCASLGFVGTSGSTIAESIELMRRFRVCSS